MRVKPGTEIEQVQAICETASCMIKKQMEFTEQEYLLEVLGVDASAVFATAELLNGVSCVVWAGPNIAFQLQFSGQITPNDEYFHSQWYLNNTGQSGGTPDMDINAPEAWEITTGDPNIVVAVLDTGVDIDHPDLAPNLVAGFNAVNPAFPPDELFPGHGTANAGLIAAVGGNGIGVVGIAPNCKIMPVKIASGPEDFVSVEAIASAIRRAAWEGADVLNLSWGGARYFVVAEAIEEIAKPGGVGRDGKGCVVLSVAGNDASAILFPAKHPDVIAVGAIDKHGDVWDYSCYGPELDIVAPPGNIGAGDIWTTDIMGSSGYGTGDYIGNFGGTSAAFAITAGVAALVLSRDSDLTSDEVAAILLGSTVDLGDLGKDVYYGWGKVDAMNALESMIAPRHAVFVDDDAENDPSHGDPYASDPLEDGSVTHPFDSIQEGINRAGWLDEVIVAEGTYTGEGNRDISLQGKAVRVRSESGPERCIIDCAGSVQTPHRGFIFARNSKSVSIVEGFTITNGYAEYGGGVYGSGSRSRATIKNCVISKNMCVDGGGGFFGCHGLITGCDIVDNEAGKGGGGLDWCLGEIRSCTIRDNRATTTNTDRGSSDGLYNCDGLIVDCHIEGNTASRHEPLGVFDYDCGGGLLLL